MLENKKINQIIQKIKISIFLLGICLIFQEHAFAKFDYQNGHFEKIDTKLQVDGCPLKLNDGKVLILNLNNNYIFNPKTDTFREIAHLPNGFSYVVNTQDFPATVLNNGKVLIIGNILEPPSEKFKEIENIVIKWIVQTRSSKNLILSQSEQQAIRKEARLQAFKIPEAEKENIYLPQIRKNPQLYSEYKSYKQAYEKSKHALLFDPITERFDYTGRPNTEARYSTNLHVLSKADGNALLFFTNGEIELYNSKTGQFSLLNKIPQNLYSDRLIKLNENTVFYGSEKEYLIYYIDTNTYSNWQHYPVEFTELNKYDDNNLLLIGTQKTQSLHLFNPLNYTLKYISTFGFKRDLHSVYPLTPIILNDTIIFLGGYLDDWLPMREFLEMKRNVYKKSEIFDVKTGSSKIVNTKLVHLINKWVLLDDGRILIRNWELYIPKLIP